MSFSEQALIFQCAGEKLLGIVAIPEQPMHIGVLVVVGGPQYRVGSHRQFLLLTRALASAGYASMRFDYRGMGDSTGNLRNFQMVDEDIGAAIDTLRSNCPQVTKIVLLGLCDAASASLLYCDYTHDEVVAGLCLLNPWVRSEATLAKTHIRHYYGQRLLKPEFWRKFLSGKLGVGRAISGFLQSLKKAGECDENASANVNPSYQEKMARSITNFAAPVLLILSSNDYTAKEFMETVQNDPAWVNALTKSTTTQIEIEGADHTFSMAEWWQTVENTLIQWLGKLGTSDCHSSRFETIAPLS